MRCFRWLLMFGLAICMVSACTRRDPKIAVTPVVKKKTVAPVVKYTSQTCKKETASLQKALDELHRRSVNLETVNKTLSDKNAYLSHQSEKLELELRKRDALVQIQGNVIQLLDDAEKTIETGLREEMIQKTKELESQGRRTLRRYPVEALFKPGTFNISSRGEKTLTALADQLKQHPGQKVYVEGHTDDVPVSETVKDTYPSNWEVSAARAAAVVRFLTFRAGLAPDRFLVVGHGAARPVASNLTPEGRQNNRRVEIILGPEF